MFLGFSVCFAAVGLLLNAVYVQVVCVLWAKVRNTQTALKCFVAYKVVYKCTVHYKAVNVWCTAAHPTHTPL